MELAARILSYCSRDVMPVSLLVRRVGGSHDKAVAVIKELRERSLLVREMQEAAVKSSVGRPRQYLRPTPLGRQFLREYDHLRNLALQSNENDIRKALHQAELARRLVDSGISPYARFQEMNQLARNIASTAKAQRGSQ